MTTTLGNQPMPPHMLGGNYPYGPGSWQYEAAMAARGLPFGPGTPEYDAAIAARGAPRTDVVKPTGQVRTPPMFSQGFMGMGGQGGGGDSGGGGGIFRFGVRNPAHQPLADDLNTWLAGGFSGPNAPGARGPGMPPRKRR